MGIDTIASTVNMIKALLLLSALVALGAAGDAYEGYWGNGYPWWGAPWYNFWGGYPGYYGYNNGYNYGAYGGGYAPYNRLVFYGKFAGTCEQANDGIYFVDERSFAYCSNGQKTIQPCAEGSANPPISHYKDGNYYALYDFCSINLVAKGYHPKAPVHPSAPAPGYVAPKKAAYPSPPFPEKGSYAPRPTYEGKTEYGTYSETSYEETKEAHAPKY